jgi:putative flippase GtrA
MPSRTKPAISEHERFIRFLLTGGFSAGVNILSRLAFNLVLPYEAAITAAYLVGMTTAFVLARLFVFDGTGGRARVQYVRFALVNAVAFLQVWLVSVGLARLAFPYFDFVWHADTIAHVIGVASPIITSYFGHKYFSFAR